MAVTGAAVWLCHGSTSMTLAMTGLSLLAIYKHKANIQRLLKGTERRMGERTS